MNWVTLLRWLLPAWAMAALWRWTLRGVSTDVCRFWCWKHVGVVPPRWAIRHAFVRETLLLALWGDMYLFPSCRWHLDPRRDPRGKRRMEGAQ